MKTHFRQLAFLVMVGLAVRQPSEGQVVGDNNPTGPTGEYNGSITTGGSYDPQTGNAKRFVDDLTVTGSLGAYPLKWTRILNTRDFGWSHPYRWALWTVTPDYHYHNPPYEGPDGQVTYPDGRVMTLIWTGPGAYQQSAGVEPMDQLVEVGGGNYDLIMHDGGRVHFQCLNPNSTTSFHFRAVGITDPYGVSTSLIYDPQNRLWKITEPGGRFLQINYRSPTSGFLDNVQAQDGRGNTIETVRYTYTPIPFGQWTGSYLTRVDYDDGSFATYSYQEGNMGNVAWGLVSTCHDVRYGGVMKNIEYEYMTWSGQHRTVVAGQIAKEKNAATHQVVSEITYPVDYPPVYPAPTAYFQRTEHKGDGSPRVFQYSNQLPGELFSYTDFRGHISQIDYSYVIGANTYQKILTDARLFQTTIEKHVITGAVMSVKRGVGQPATFTYSDANHPHYLASKSDENGKITWYDRDSANRIWQIRYPDGGFETFTYDGNPFGLIHTHRMTSGGAEVFEYDDRGLKRFYRPPGTDSDPHPENHRTEYTYYDISNCGGRLYLIDRLYSVKDPWGYLTYYDYNQRGQVTQIKHPDDTHIDNTYYPDGTLHTGSDELQHITEYTYDEYKRVRTITNPLLKVTENSYAPWNGSGPLSHTTSSVYLTTFPSTKAIKHNYDENFRLIETTRAPETTDRATTTYTYDEVGNQITVTNPNGQLDGTSPYAHSTAVYDDRNRRTSLSDEFGHATVWEYDDAGNLKKETRADTKFRTWDLYDGMNRITQTTGFLRTNDATLYDYRPSGNLWHLTDCNGGVYTYYYDASGRKERVTYPHDAASTGNSQRDEKWGYDEAGNLKWYKTPADQYKHFEYDNRNRQTRSYWNSGEFNYAADVNVGDDAHTVPDDANRVQSITTQNASGFTAIGYGYDEANHKVAEAQVLDHNNPRMRLVGTPPDDDGNRAGLTVTDATVGGIYWLSYEYTQRQQLLRITGATGPFFEYKYDRNGNLKMRQNVLQGYDSTVFQYDKANRVILCAQTAGVNGEQGYAGDSFSVSDYNDYDLVNNLQSISRRENDFKGERFTYDDANQLASATYRSDIGERPAPPPDPDPGVAMATDSGSSGNLDKDWNREAFAMLEADPVREALVAYNVDLDHPDHDALGGPRVISYINDSINRKRINDSNGTGTTTEYTPNHLNQYTAVTGRPAPAYDGNFNLSGYDGWTYVYDADNRLISAANYLYTAHFLYDGLGRCVKRTIGGDVTVFTYDGWKPIMEWTGAGDLVAWNLYGPGEDEILFRYQGNTGGSLHYHLDPMGNVQFLLSETNGGLEKYTYDAFGRPRITGWNNDYRYTSSYGNRFMFTGREFLYTLGIYDFRHRHYHPEIGRFMQVDPIGFKGDPMNLFRYCLANPIMHGDPMGLDPMYIPDDVDFVARKAALRTEHLYNSATTFKGMERNIGVLRNNRTGAVNMSEPAIGRRDSSGKLRSEPPFAPQGYTREANAHNHPNGTRISGEDRVWGDNHHEPVYAKGRNTERWRPDEDAGKAARHQGGVRETWSDRAEKWIRESPPPLPQNSHNGSSSTAQGAGDTDAKSNDARSIDARFQATGVPSLGAEAVNHYNGVL